MDFVAHWKNWIRPLAIMVYFMLMVIAIPICLVEVTNDQKDKHVKAWFTGGVFVLMAVPISLWEIILHVINYNQPHLQKHIIRIIWMVPIYALNAWFALRFKGTAIYLDTIRECYEAYVIYNFMAYLLSYLWTVHPQLEIALSKTKQQKHLIPFCCLPTWRMGRDMIQNCKHGVLQYTIIRPITTIIALICELNDVYHEGQFVTNGAWTYTVVINNISQIWAMYCLVLFYRATRDMLAPIKPIPKFLCVKFVVFFSFWQAVVIAIFAKFGLIPKTEFYDYNLEDIAAAMQDFCICIEMFLAAVMHYFAFSHKPFIDQTAPQGNCCMSFASMWDVTDVKDDVIEHVKVISTTMKKTVSGQFRSRPETEYTPLLETASASATYQPRDDASNEVMSTDANTSRYQGAADGTNSVSEWDVTSVDRWNSRSNRDTKSVSSSMHNYLDSFSVENQSLQSDSNEHLGDTDFRKTRRISDTSQKNEITQKGKDSKDMRKKSVSDLVSETDESQEAMGEDGGLENMGDKSISEELQDALIDFSAPADNENETEAKTQDDLTRESDTEAKT